MLQKIIEKNQKFGKNGLGMCTLITVVVVGRAQTCSCWRGESTSASTAPNRCVCIFISDKKTNSIITNKHFGGANVARCDQQLLFWILFLEFLLCVSRPSTSIAIQGDVSKQALFWFPVFLLVAYPASAGCFCLALNSKKKIQQDKSIWKVF